MEAHQDTQHLKNASLFRQQGFLDGQWCDAESGATIRVCNPATGALVGTVPQMGASETRRAIEAASKAMPAWRAKTAKERAAILRRWYELILANQDDLAVLMTTEQGKPLAEAKAEVAFGAAFLEWFAEEAKRVYGDVIPPHQADKRILVLKQPVGVCGAITPWNFPSAMVTRKAGPALAAGCTMVLKPASQTPFSALALAALAHEAGVPNGAFNVVTGSAAEIGGTLTESRQVRKITFTGSTEVGRILMRQSAETIKKISLELGGNAAFLVFDDADVEQAVEGALASKFRNTGQTCVCANRILVQDGIFEVFARKFAERVRALKVGPGTEPGVQVGPLIDLAAVAKVEAHITDALIKGAAVVVGGRRHALGGQFFEPTVLREVEPDMRVFQEETFGPVAPLVRFHTDGEALALANRTDLGLAAYFYSRDIGRIFRVAEGLEAGIVAVNTGVFSTEVAPFGGVKQSGIGREGSKYGIEEFLEVKYVCLGGIDR
ncbi:MAG TPA: NAD-dependent succinate-semialdehyde dehydrogenase [Vicinamibacteria bacterium]